jgi:hypothetical protein
MLEELRKIQTTGSRLNPSKRDLLERDLQCEQRVNSLMASAGSDFDRLLDILQTLKARELKKAGLEFKRRMPLPFRPECACEWQDVIFVGG